MNNLSIAKILQVSTFILAKARFQPKENSTRYVLQTLGDFYRQNLEMWSYEKFKQNFEVNNSLGSYNSFQESANVILREIQPTNNIQQIEKYTALISEICEVGCKLYDVSEYDQLSDLIDLLHGLPEALLLKEVWYPKSFWKTYFNPYRKKWDKHFMKAEQKVIM